MERKKLEGFKKLILKEREEVLKGLLEDKEELSELTREMLSGDMADEAARTLEIEIRKGLNQSELQKYDDIKRALERIEEGTYGQCIVCQSNISENRLRAIPYATKCLKCKEREELVKRRRLGGGRTFV